MLEILLAASMAGNIFMIMAIKVLAIHLKENDCKKPADWQIRQYVKQIFGIKQKR